MKISSDELRAILEEVETELQPLLRSEKERLSKAVGDDEMSSSPSSSPMGQEASKSPGRDMLPEERSGGEESASPAPGAEASAPGMEGSAGGEGAGAEGQVEALAAEYAKLPPQELEMHLMALQAAMQQLGGGAEGSPAGSSAGSPPPAPGAEASPAMKKEMSTSAGSASASPAPAKKGEMSAEKAYSKKEKSAKEESSKEESSEKSSSMSKSEIDALNAKIDVALKAVEFLTRPMRKAVTEAAETPAKTYTRAEVTEKLKAVTANPSLAKSERALINGFYDGRVSLDKITHLLK
jgi:hypothetical protein